MGELSALINQRSVRRVSIDRSCPACKGRGTWSRPARAPDGTVPVRRVMLKIQCTDCKGKGTVRVAEEVHEKGRVRVWDALGRLVIDKPDIFDE